MWQYDLSVTCHFHSVITSNEYFTFFPLYHATECHVAQSENCVKVIWNGIILTASVYNNLSCSAVTDKSAVTDNCSILESIFEVLICLWSENKPVQSNFSLSMYILTRIPLNCFLTSWLNKFPPVRFEGHNH